tara:strand:- start:278 stop:781 length:504 start_codon:yes stop_codon:yes gene_type:complete
MQVYGFRIILDFKKEDIFRDIEISDKDNFEDLHNSIVQSFGLDVGEMASFYKSDDQWNQGDEISLFPVDDNSLIMSDFNLSQICINKGDKLLYIFDFLNMWTFYVELMEINKNISGVNYPRVIYSEGIMPGEREDIQFKSQVDYSKSNREQRLIDDDDIFQEFDEFN